MAEPDAAVEAARLSHLRRAQWDEAFTNAAQGNRLGELKLAVANGANVDAIGGNGMSAAHWACQDHRVELLQYLVEQTACTLNAVDSEGYTPLLIAAEKGHVECVRLLVRGARAAGDACDVGVRLADGYTALRIAAEEAQRGSQRHAAVASLLQQAS